jgi:hypothetical protein
MWKFWEEKKKKEMKKNWSSEESRSTGPMIHLDPLPRLALRRLNFWSRSGLSLRCTAKQAIWALSYTIRAGLLDHGYFVLFVD